jgi:2-polyprenyl-6-hydroxyphenyl methylase/3-demethylubiquinone-9 3-methyltransferase
MTRGILPALIYPEASGALPDSRGQNLSGIRNRPLRQVIKTGMLSSLKWKLAQGLEIRWWENYLKGKEVSAYLEWKQNYWLEFLSSIQFDRTELAGKRVLDAGCGPAGIFMALPESEVTAVDPLLDQYQEKLEHFRREAYPQVRFNTSSLEHFKSDRSFDAIFCLNAINHVANLDLAMDNLFRYAAPDSKLVLSIDCHRFSALKYLFRLLPGDALHPHQLDLNDYRTMVQSRGGRIIREVLSKPGRIFDYSVLVIETRPVKT